MDCRLFRLLMQRYHDGELDPAERAEYENHRRGCAECRALDGRLALLVRALDGAPRFEPSAGFNARVLSRVDIAAYRVGPVRRALRAAERGWNTTPVPLRNGAVVVALCAMIIAVYKPLLDHMITTIRQGVEALWSGIIVIQELGHKVETIWRSAGTVRNYEVVGQTLLRAFHRFASGVNLGEISLAIASLALVALVLYRMRAAARRKGETNVCIM